MMPCTMCLDFLYDSVSAGPALSAHNRGAELFWPITKHVSIDANYAYFAAGEFLHENPPDKNLSYVGLIFSYRF
ncbi:MAG: hypothetical protein DMG14_03525 [Acidobacteria bacterium]|nr:MAG: hypothetical protein DMG14_03525 [Acidobacteriota bacterium]